MQVSEPPTLKNPPPLSLMDWVGRILLTMFLVTLFFIMPNYVYGDWVCVINTCFACSICTCNGIGFAYGRVKIWPKLIEMTSIFSNALTMILYFSINGVQSFIKDPAVAASIQEDFVSQVLFFWEMGACMLLSCAIGVPFALQIGKEFVDESQWSKEWFTTFNLHLSLVIGSFLLAMGGINLIARFALVRASESGAQIFQVVLSLASFFALRRVINDLIATADEGAKLVGYDWK